MIFIFLENILSHIFQQLFIYLFHKKKFYHIYSFIGQKYDEKNCDIILENNILDNFFVIYIKIKIYTLIRFNSFLKKLSKKIRFQLFH